MKTLRAQLFLLFTTFFVASLAWGQQPFPGGSPYVSHQLLAFPVYSLNAAPVAGASLYTVGVSGQTTYCYWAVANYQIGAVLSGLGCIPNSTSTLSGSNYNAISPWLYPAGLSAGVDILRTVTAQAPTGACNCAVTSGVTSGVVNDQSNSLSSYTVTLLQPNKLALTLTNEVVGGGASHFILRQGWPYPGTQIADLSASGVGCGTGTSGNLMEFTGTSTCGNAPIVDGGTTGLLATAPSTGTVDLKSGSTTGGEVIAAGTGSGVNTYIGTTPQTQLGSATAVGYCIFQAGVVTCKGLTTSQVTAVLQLSGANASGAASWSIGDSTSLNGICGIATGNGSSSTCFGSGPALAGIEFRVNTGNTFSFRVAGGSNAVNINSTVVQVQSGQHFQSVTGAFSTLPACITGTEGSFAAVNDSTTNTWGATITGSGANHVLAYCDGTNWTVSAK